MAISTPDALATPPTPADRGALFGAHARSPWPALASLRVLSKLALGGLILPFAGCSGGASVPGHTGPFGAAGGGPIPPGGFGGSPPAPQPSFGITDTTGSPPPISGGTLLVTLYGDSAVASDPDRDAVYVVDLNARSLKYTIALQPGDEPGRLAEDGAGHVHVALRGSGALVTLDPATGTIVSRRTACPAPRGLAWDRENDLVWVACATGELVALPASGGAAVRSLVVERDLRDVIVRPDGTLTVSKFRAAETLHLGSDGTMFERTVLQVPNSLPSSGFAAQVAWRTIAGPSTDSALVSYQVESTSQVNTNTPGGYTGGGGGGFGGRGGGLIPPDGGGVFFVSVEAGSGPLLPSPPPLPPFPGGGSIVQSAVAVLGSDGFPVGAPMALPQAVLPVDVALSPDRSQIAVAAAGTGFSGLGKVWLLGTQGSAPAQSIDASTSPVVAVAFDGRGNVLVQTLEPASLILVSTKAVSTRGSGQSQGISLSSTSQHNTGHDIFHTQAGGLIACASCHPEGGDDGHLWMLDGLPRRTPSLRGTIAGTAPYHWPGDEANMGFLIDDVYTKRMSGAPLASSEEQALTSWVEGIPAPAAPSWVDANAAKRGQALFQGSAGCTACHSGAKLTNNATLDIGTAAQDQNEGPFPPLADAGPTPTAFQVPPLVGVGWRTPLFHNGCATTMADRFGKCATPAHGSTAQLSPHDIDDLTAYLESL